MVVTFMLKSNFVFVSAVDSFDISVQALYGFDSSNDAINLDGFDSFVAVIVYFGNFGQIVDCFGSSADD